MRIEENKDNLEVLLDYIKRHRGFDFTGYKRTSLGRRVRKRMSEVAVESYSEYLRFLEANPDEFTSLFNTILINVTHFFRDPEAWQYLQDEIIPKIIANKPDNLPIRIWCAGAASGEEAYSIAMLMVEALGEADYRDRVKIYATDVDENALDSARRAEFTPKALEDVKEELVKKYFERNGAHYIFRKDLRRIIIFGRQDLVQDPPISKIDLLICRNILMYFNPEAQTQIIARLNFALNDPGYLFLGKAEMLLSHSNLFTPVNINFRIFKNVVKIPYRDRLLLLNMTNGERAADDFNTSIRLRNAAFDSSPIALVVLDSQGRLAVANEFARNMFSLTIKDFGKPVQDLELSYRPIDLRPGIDKARAEKKPFQIKKVEWLGPGNNQRYLEVQIAPLTDNGNDNIGTSISFLDITSHIRLQNQFEQINQDLETTMEELQSTNEEMETTNEELQSTVEELETTNEELQSSNEELETMNEELQSTNQEIETVNQELHLRNQAFDEMNKFLNSILSSINGAVVVLDSDLQVELWSVRAEDMWGLRPDEVIGRSFLNLDIGLPVFELKRPIRKCLADSNENQIVTVEARNRRGHDIQVEVTCTPRMGYEGMTEGVILIMNKIKQ
jgi:two-component system CheB/CheR fusion protein